METGVQADQRRLAALRGADGSVTIPPRLVGWVGALIGDALQDLRRAGRGGSLAADVLDVLDALNTADIGSEQPAFGSLKVGQILTCKQAARVLECGERAVRLALQEGRLAGFKSGERHWLIDSDALENYRFAKGS